MPTATYKLNLLSPAILFDGVDDFVNVTGGPTWGTTVFTLEGWVFPTSNNDMAFVSSRNPSATRYFRRVPGGAVFVSWTDSAGVQQTFQTAGTPLATLSKWYHVAYTHDGTNARIYVDDGTGVVLVGTGPASSLGGTAVAGLEIGRHPTPSLFVAGRIDEVRRWTVARSLTEIADNRFRRLVGTETNLAGLWRMDEGIGTQAKDGTANTAHGTLTNGPAWTERIVADIMPDVREIRINRGASDLRGAIVTGQCTVVLNNKDSIYSPDNTAGKFFGLLRPFLKFEFEGTFGVTVRKRFTGYMLEFDLDTRLARDGEDERVTRVPAEDRFRVLRGKKTTTGILQSLNLSTVITTVLDDIGVVAADRVLDTVVDTTPFAMFTKQDAIDALAHVVEAGQYTHFIGTDGKYTLKSRYWTMLGVSVATYQTQIVRFKPVYNDTDIFNFVQVKSNPRKKDAALAIVARLQVSAAAPFEIAVGQAKTFFIEYVDPTLQTAQRIPADEMQVPVATTDYTANSLADGTGTDLTASLGVVTTFFAETAKVTLTNNAAVTMFVTKFDLRGKPFRLQTPILFEAQDAESQDLYQRRDLVFENDIIATDLYAIDMGNFLLREKKEVVPLARMTLRNVFPDLLTLDLGQVVTIVDTLAGINYKMYVLGLDELVTDEGQTHETVYTLRKWAVQPWLILDADPEGRLDQRQLAF